MSKKIILFLLCLCLMAGVAFLPSQAREEHHPVVHQHLTAPKETEAVTGLDAETGVLSSHLPLVILHADGNTIPGTSREDLRTLTCRYDIIDNKNGVNRSDDVPAQTGLSELSVRGNTSRRFPKKQYSLRTVNEKKEKENVSLLGMPKESSWVLNGSYIDNSMLRNYMLYNISGEIMDYAPHSRLCEVLITDADKKPLYNGVYTLIEKPKVSKRRLNLKKYDPAYAETSFLLQMNSHIDGIRIDHLKPDAVIAYALEVEYPNPAVITPETEQYIRDEMLRFEKILLDASNSGNWKLVEEAVDMDSFVDYYLINEFFQNFDAGRRSTYIYKAVGGKFSIGPVWDFDGAFNNFTDINLDIDYLDLKTTFYYRYLTQCPAFAELCSERYKELRRSIFSEEYLLRYIDEAAAYLGSAAERNCDRWYDGDLSRFTGDIEKMKDFIRERGAWMDENFDDFCTVIH